MRLFLAGCVLAIAAQAQAVAIWTCTRDFVQTLSGGTLVTGNCTGSGTYTVGGDPLGTTGSVAATGAALCGSSTRVLKHAVIGLLQSDSSNTLAWAATYNATTFTIQLFGKTVGATGIGEADNTANLVGFQFPFVATCK
jgi:hypothetical protein